MATETEASAKIAGDKYRSFMRDEGENNTLWRYGGPPLYDTKWPKGSLEETVQNAIKSWEMEVSHKTRVQDVKTINPNKFMLVVNGPPLTSVLEIPHPTHTAIKIKEHWGFFEGPFKGHAPTGEMIELYGMGILKVDESLKAENVEVYYDPAELFGGLLKQPLISDSQMEQPKPLDTSTSTQKCPFAK
ncbi:hypothetical protein L1049_000763 [Liquidambar formosana]|uniref:Pathogen-related protein n=1 Tax=Liquidambar formosana TaxID=63359 RepID=A0AAP0R7Y4_LIQFO